MGIAVECNCGKQLTVKDEFAGRKVRCPACKGVIATPAWSAPPRELAVAQSRSAATTPDVGEPDAEPSTPPKRQIVLRMIVLILGVVGAGSAGFLGFRYYSNAHDAEQQRITESNRATIKKYESTDPSSSTLKSAHDNVEKFELFGRACYPLLAAAVLGLAGGVLAFKRRRLIAVPLLLLPPAVVGVIAVQVVAFTAPLILGGLLSLMIKPWR